MAEFARKLRNLLPTLPGRRYQIFAGTNTREEWCEALRAWLRQELPSEEEDIRAYEAEFARTVGTDHAISFGAGRMAFYAILAALDIGEGAEVILPAYTCVVVPNTVLYRGARPVYVDIEPRTFNIDVNRVEAAITPKTRALYAQHTFGMPCDITALKEIARRHRLVVIEDCGHALGATLNGRPVGSLSEAAYFTTDHSKMASTYLGGMAATCDPSLARSLRQIQQQAPFLSIELHRRLLRSFLSEYVLLAPSAYWLGRSVQIVAAKLGWHFSFNDELLTTRPSAYPYPCRLSALQARIGSSQLRLLPDNLAHRRRLASLLESWIGWNGLREDEFFKSSWLRYSFLVRDRQAVERRFQRRLELNIWFSSVAHGRNSDFAAIGYREGICPVAEAVARHIANFPTHPRLPFEVLSEKMVQHGAWLNSQLLDPEELL